MDSSTRTDNPGDSAWERPLLLAGFLITGVTAVLLGPLIPELEALWGINHSQSGSLFLVQFAASSVAAIVSNFNLRRSLVAGYALSTVSLFGLVYGGWPLARVFMTISGFSLGLVISGSNLLVAKKNPEHRGAALSTLNLTWGLGAVACPLLFAVFVESVGAFAMLQGIGLLAAAVSLSLAFILRNPSVRTTANNEADDRGRSGSSPQSPVSLLVLVGALFFFYVGTEISIGGWLVTLAEQFSAGNGVISLLIGSGFWGAVLLGRAGAAIALRSLGEASVYSVSLIVAGIGAVCLFLADSQATVAAGAILAGLGLAALFPLTVSILTSATVSNRPHVAGVLLACGGLGGSLLPWLTGRLSRASGAGSSLVEASLSRGFLVPIAGLAALCVLFIGYQKMQTAQRMSRKI